MQAVLGQNYGTSAYVVSPAGARALLDGGVLPLRQQIDSYIIEMVERDAIEAYVTQPPLAWEMKTLHESDIQQTRL